ncbi:hypothetical protein B566_EDAN001870 [Ephemera danica]|nr:hypothetical protein B566_EDAN001870 [Ephemera danica]
MHGTDSSFYTLIPSTFKSTMEVARSPVILTIGNFELRFEEDEELDAEYAEIAERELRETPDVRAAAIERLRELLLADEKLHFPTEEESRLLIFLRPCKFYPESAYQLIQRYYQFRLTNPKVYKDLTPKNESNVFQQGILSVIPRRDQHGRRILLLEAGDEAGLSLNHVMQFTPSFARAVITWVQSCLPVRFKAVHIVNQPYIFNMVFAIFKPFMQEKLRNRIHLHGTDRKSLLKHIDAEALPVRYGGTLDIPEVPSTTWHELMMTRNADYELLNTFGYKD